MLCAFLFSVITPLVQGDTIASPWPFQHVGKNANLSNSAITSVYMDRHDQVWFGTWDGLDQYNGSSIKVYKPDPFVKGTISNNVVRTFLEDGLGNLWVVTHHGINKYDRTSDSFQTYLNLLNDIPLLEYNIRACVGPDSVIWASLIGKGISRYSDSTNQFVSITFKGIEPQWLTSVVDLGAQGKLLYLLGADGRLICTSNNRKVFSHQLVKPDQLSMHKFIRMNGRYFLALVTKAGQLQLYDMDDVQQEPERLELGPLLISSLSETSDHSAVWIGTETGDVLKLHSTGSSFQAKSMNAYFPSFSRARIKILAITETSQDLLWVGTDGDGVYKFLTRPKMFYSIPSGPSEKGLLSHSIVRSIYEDASGKLFVGTRGGGLNIISQGEPAKIINSKNGLSNNAVLSLNKDHKGNIWIGLDGEGIDMMEANTGKLFHFPRDFENRSDLNFSSVYSICIDSFNEIWLGTSGYGVIHLKIHRSVNGRYHLTEYDQLQHSGKTNQLALMSNVVYSIVEEKPNALWFGTRGGGIYRYNPLTKKIEAHIQAGGIEKNSLSNNDVLSLWTDKQEQLWVGTSGGLNRLRLQTKPYRIDHYTQRNGLPNNTVHGILEDEKENIWVSTNQGLILFDRTKNSFKNFDTNDGLSNSEFADGATFKSRHSERLFFGGMDGLDIIHPSKLSTPHYFPKLIITEFQVQNKIVIPGDETALLANSIDRTNHLTLAYDQNFVSFLFTTLNYWNKEKSEFAYFLENFDKDWNKIGQQQSVTFTNIPPGHYRLRINNTNETGTWNSLPRTIEITVTPPFWKTWWAYSLYILLAIAVQTGIVLYIRQRARSKKMLAMAKFKAIQLKELNDYKLQFFTNVAHEFRTPLTLILGPVTSLLHHAHDEVDKKQLKTIYSNSLRLQKLIEELIQFRKIVSGKDRLNLLSVNLVSFTQVIVESFQQHALDRDILLEYNPEPDALQACVDPKKIEKILINLISNAIKYSMPGGKVSVSLEKLRGQVLFKIRDEGIGIAESNKEKIFESFYQNSTEVIDATGLAKSTGIGLSLTKSLVLIHHGTITLESRVGKGSIFTVAIPVENAFMEPASENSVLLSHLKLEEKVSLEFESNYYLPDQTGTVNTSPGKPAHSILVVDDNPQITSLLENILIEKYRVYSANSGERALQVIEQHGIDLVISDVVMSNMDGLTLCKKIKENIQTSHIPVILLTAKGEIEHRIDGLKVGADSYIPKPFHHEHLLIRIEKLIERIELIRKKFRNLSEVELTQLSTGISERDDAFFLRITSCIESHLSEPEFNADTIADEVGMSKASLYKKVKTITGLTPHGLIKQYRLKKAADLLRNSEMSVSEVIYETGFNSRSYFYKSFNEMFHCHPKDVERLGKL